MDAILLLQCITIFLASANFLLVMVSFQDRCYGDVFFHSIMGFIALVIFMTAPQII